MPIVRTTRPPTDSAALRTHARCERVLRSWRGSLAFAHPTAAVAPSAPMNSAPKAASLELRLGLGRAIGAVGEHTDRRVALGQEPIERLAVVDRCIGHLVAPD